MSQHHRAVTNMCAAAPYSCRPGYPAGQSVHVHPDRSGGISAFPQLRSLGNVMTPTARLNLFISCSVPCGDVHMAVSVYCEACDYRFQVHSRHRGQMIRCPSCSEPVHVSSGARSNRVRRTRRKRADRRPGRTISNRTGLLLGACIAAAMLLLFYLVYVAFGLGQATAEH